MIITTRGLTRTFTVKKEQLEAVKPLDLDIAEGELVAFLGPNGAGKSTTLRLLTGLLAPSGGTAVVAGHDVALDPDAVRRRIGYVGQGNSAGHYQRVRDELVSQGAFYGLGAGERRRRADALLEAFDLTAQANRNVVTLSGGQRRRLDVAMGLVHTPQLLFLDEPSTGLDPQSRANLWQHILQLHREHGTTVFLTTHYLEEADGMAARVMVMDHGELIADDTSDALKRRHAGDHLVLGFASAASAGRAARIIAGQLDGERTEQEGSRLRIAVPDGTAVLPELLRRLDAQGEQVASAESRRPTLDDVFLALTGRSLREEVAA